jgi:hypothetical protein
LAESSRLAAICFIVKPLAKDIAQPLDLALGPFLQHTGIPTLGTAPQLLECGKVISSFIVEVDQSRYRGLWA